MNKENNSVDIELPSTDSKIMNDFHNHITSDDSSIKTQKKKYKRPNSSKRNIVHITIEDTLLKYGSEYGVEEMFRVLKDVIHNAQLKKILFHDLTSDYNREKGIDMMRELNKDSYLEDGWWKSYED
jgi:hypothetical protein